MTADEFFDYEEAVDAFCTVPGCDWHRLIGWSDLAADAEKPTIRDDHRAHFIEAHPELTKGAF